MERKPEGSNFPFSLLERNKITKVYKGKGNENRKVSRSRLSNFFIFISSSLTKSRIQTQHFHSILLYQESNKKRRKSINFPSFVFPSPNSLFLRRLRCRVIFRCVAVLQRNHQQDMPNMNKSVLVWSASGWYRVICNHVLIVFGLTRPPAVFWWSPCMVESGRPHNIY